MPFWRVGIHDFHICSAKLMIENCRFWLFLQKNVTALNWRRPGAGAFGTSFWRVVASSKSHRALGLFQFLTKKTLLLEPPKVNPIHNSAHAGCRLAAAKRDRRKLIIEENNGLSQWNVSLKVTQFSKLYITARMLGPGGLPKRGIAGS